MLITSVAVVAFFARNAQLSAGRPWQTRIAPLLAVAGLLTALWLVFSNFTLVTGGGVGVSIVLGVIPFLALIAGLVRGAHGPRGRS
ncbi:hypothetical protein [Streptomyces sp. Mo3]